MARKSWSTLAVFLCFSFLIQLALPLNESNDDLTQKVISALNSLLDFYHRDFMSINLDGIFGLRVAQGAFLSLINDVQDGQLSLEGHVLNQVKGLYNKASLVGQDSLPYLKKATPEYFRKFKKQVSNPWMNFKPFTNKELLKRHYDPQEKRNVISFDETQSDKCMVEITGTGASVDVGQPCQVSDECWRLISSEGAQGYTLTHQALFLLLGEIQGCTPMLLKRLKQSNVNGGLEQIYNRICSDMYPQMTAVERSGQPIQNSAFSRDLYMEQAMVCGSIGYQDFLSHERLRQILTWQRKDGCFSEREADSEENVNQEINIDDRKTGNTKKELDTPFDDIRQSLENEDSKILRKPLSLNRRTMRSLLVEKKLNDGCLSHLTGVAAGLLGVYLRWLLHSQVELRIQKGVNNRKLQNNQLDTEPDVYADETFGEFIAQKERQLQQQEKMKQELFQRAHLRQMRRAAMLDDSAQEVLRREESGFFPWGTVAVLCVCSVFLVFSLVCIKGIKGALNIVETVVTRSKKRAHVI